VAELFADDLTPARFRVSTDLFLFGLPREHADNGRLRIFLALPDAAQASFYGHLIRVGHATWAAPSAAASRRVDRRASIGQEGGAR
jgi:hypothetical protein